MNLLLVVILPLVGAALAGWASRFGRVQAAWTAGGQVVSKASATPGWRR